MSNYNFLECNVDEFGPFPEIIWFLSPEMTWPNYLGDYSCDNDKYGFEEAETGGRQTSKEAVTRPGHHSPRSKRG